jgi:hypothetical protein
MSKELIPYVTGKTPSTIVARWSNLAGQSLIASGGGAGTFEDFDSSRLATYRVAASAEQGTDGVYEITVPTPDTLPVVMPFVVHDTGTGQLIASGVTVLDAAGNAVHSQLDMGQAVPVDAAEGTLGESLLAARAQGVGKWVVSEDGLSLTIYLPDGTTPLQVFALDRAKNPLSRTPQ